jgi:hypothetical protein
MSGEKALLDNLHGRIKALTALCTAVVATSKDAGKIMALFQKELQEMHNKSDESTKSDSYFLGVKTATDHLIHEVQRIRPDLASPEETSHKRSSLSKHHL